MTPGDPRYHLGARITKTVLAINNHPHATGMGVFHYGEIMTEKNKLTHDDLYELGITPGKVGSNFVPEQERNFDAGYTPSDSSRQYVGEEWIDGKLYKVWQ